MKIDRTAFALGLSGIASLALFAVSSFENKKRHRRKMKEENKEDIELLMECLDEIILDIKQSNQKQDEQNERITRLEEKMLNLVPAHSCQ